MANTQPAQKQKKILMVVANPTISTTLGWPVGFWASELTHPYVEFTDAGYQVDIASPQGGVAKADSYSDPRDASGYSAKDFVSLGFLSSPQHAALLESTIPVSQVRVADYDAIVVCGGQAPMFTFREDRGLRDLFVAFYSAGKISAALCHGTAVLLDLKLASGELLIKGKAITGFTSAEEDAVDAVMGKKVMPYRIEDEARHQGANFVAYPAFQSHALRDGNLITGQQQNSGKAVARLIIEALGK